jgi:heme-degrading monooxygenase HmoA
MFVAVSRFAVKNGMDQEVRRAFQNRPRGVDSVPGFLWLEVFQREAEFLLVTRWTDEPAFRAWHSSPAHHESHRLIPAGLKLDPSKTQLLVGERLDGVTSQAAAGELTGDLSQLVAQLLRESSGLCAAVVDGGGRVVRANPAFSRMREGADGTSWPLGSLIMGDSMLAIERHLASGSGESFLVQLTPAGRDPVSLRVFVRALGDGFALVGEPPWDDHLSLEASLTRLNAELAVLSRENARQTRLLLEAHERLRDAHWHLEKIGEVLPMCVGCRAVKTGDDTWEEVSSYLVAHSNFLSHGYCARCAERLIATLEEDA